MPAPRSRITRVAEIASRRARAPALGGGPWLLIEPPFTSVATGLDDIVLELQSAGHRVVLAHPERCPAFHRDPRMLRSLVDGGVLTSITAGSLVGRFGGGRGASRSSCSTTGLVHNVTSDAHDHRQRPPGIAAELEQAGLDPLAEWLTEEVPARDPRRRGEIPPRPVVDLAADRDHAARPLACSGWPAQASFVIATTMPIRTNTTIAICIQIQVGDMASNRVVARPGECRRPSAGARLSCRDDGTRAHFARGPRTRLAARPRRLLLCWRSRWCRAWLAPASRGAAGAGAHASSTAPLGGVNMRRCPATTSLAGADQEIAAAHALHAKVVRVEVPWSVLEPRGAEPDRRTRPRVRRPPDERRAGGRHRRDRDGRQHAVLGVLGAGVAASKHAPPDTRARPTPGRRAIPRLRGLRRLPRPALRHDAGRDRGLERARPGQRSLLRRARQSRSATPRCCAPPTRRSSRRTRSVPVLAGSLVGSNGVFLRALYAAGIKGYYDGLSVHFYTLTLASLRSIHEVAARQRRQHAAVARRVRLEQLLATAAGSSRNRRA